MITVLYDDILKLIPHRPPTLLINKVELNRTLKTGTGYYNKSFETAKMLHSLGCTNDLPLSCLMEGIFQTAGVMRKSLTNDSSGDKLLIRLNNVLYTGKASSANEICFGVVIHRISKFLDCFTGTILSDGKKVLECEAYVGGQFYNG